MLAVVESALRVDDHALVDRVRHAGVEPECRGLLFAVNAVETQRINIPPQLEHLPREPRKSGLCLLLIEGGEVELNVVQAAETFLHLDEEGAEPCEAVAVEVDPQHHLDIRLGQDAYGLHDPVVVVLLGEQVALALGVVPAVAVKGDLHPLELPDLLHLPGKFPGDEAGVGYHPRGEGHIFFGQSAADVGDSVRTDKGLAAEPGEGDTVLLPGLADVVYEPVGGAAGHGHDRVAFLVAVGAACVAAGGGQDSVGLEAGAFGLHYAYELDGGKVLLRLVVTRLHDEPVHRRLCEGVLFEILIALACVFKMYRSLIFLPGKAYHLAGEDVLHQTDPVLLKGYDKPRQPESCLFVKAGLFIYGIGSFVGSAESFHFHHLEHYNILRIKLQEVDYRLSFWSHRACSKMSPEKRPIAPPGLVYCNCKKKTERGKTAGQNNGGNHYEKERREQSSKPDRTGIYP